MQGLLIQHDNDFLLLHEHFLCVTTLFWNHDCRLLQNDDHFLRHTYRTGPQYDVQQQQPINCF